MDADHSLLTRFASIEYRRNRIQYPDSDFFFLCLKITTTIEPLHLRLYTLLFLFFWTFQKGCGKIYYWNLASIYLTNPYPREVYKCFFVRSMLIGAVGKWTLWTAYYNNRTLISFLSGSFVWWVLLILSLNQSFIKKRYNLS